MEAILNGNITEVQSVTVYVIRGRKPDSDTEILRCVGNYYGERLPSGLCVYRMQGKRPYLVSGQNKEPFNNVYFSVSHSGEYWCCALSNGNVGFDIQIESSADCAGIAKRFFHPIDADAVVKDGGKELFFDIWAAKESVVKFYGKGIDGDFSSYIITENGEVADKCGDVFLSPIQMQAGYHAFLSSQAPPDIKVVFE